MRPIHHYHRSFKTQYSHFAAIFLVTFTLLGGLALGAEVGEGAGEYKETMLNLIKKGGPVMIPLGIASILALAIGLERFLSLTKEKVLPAGFLKGLGQAWESDASGNTAEKYCDDSSGSCGHIFKAGIQWRDEGHQAVGKAIEDAGAKEADKMKRSLRPLSVIAGVCPLLGLLGTVYGMIDAFQKTAESGGAAKTTDLANGIYQALVSTAAGLTIAIPVLLLFQWLSSRADKVIDHIDEVGTEFIAHHVLNKTALQKQTAENQSAINQSTEKTQSIDANQYY